MRLTHLFASVVVATTCLSAPAVAAPLPLTPAHFPQALTTHEAPHADTILWRVNQLRATLGLAPVIRVTELDAVAQNWSEYMAATDVLDHRPGFTDYYPEGWTNASENVAMRQSHGGEDAGTELYLQWENSPGHYSNMVNPDTNVIGIGISFNPATNSWYATQNFGSYPDPSHLTVSTAGAAENAPRYAPAPTPPDSSIPATAPDETSTQAAVDTLPEEASRENQERLGAAALTANQLQTGHVSAQSGTQYIQPVVDPPSVPKKAAPAHTRDNSTPSALSSTGTRSSVIGVAVVIFLAGAVLLTLQRSRYTQY